MLTAARLREVLDYNPETGEFRWRMTLSQRAPAGSVAGCISPEKYIRIRIDGVLYHGHRLAWLYVHGEWPSKRLDHKNVQRGENRIANLREATASQNLANRGLDKNNTSGVKGVSWWAGRSKWVAKIECGGRKHTLGYFDSKEAAAAAYASAATRLFGEFARVA